MEDARRKTTDSEIVRWSSKEATEADAFLCALDPSLCLSSKTLAGREELMATKNTKNSK
jgi:hypothetical protein